MYNFAHFGFIRSYKTTRPILLLVCNTLRFLDTSATSTPCTAISATTVPFPRPGRILSSRIPGQVGFSQLILPPFLLNIFFSQDCRVIRILWMFARLASLLYPLVPWFRLAIYQSGFPGSGQSSTNQGSMVQVRHL